MLKGVLLLFISEALMSLRAFEMLARQGVSVEGKEHLNSCCPMIVILGAISWSRVGQKLSLVLCGQGLTTGGKLVWQLPVGKNVKVNSRTFGLKRNGKMGGVATDSI